MKRSQIILAADPGLTGALAVMKNGKIIAIHDAPIQKKENSNRNEYIVEEMWELVAPWQHQQATFILENVNAMPGQGVTSMFSMGFGFGLWRAMISAARMNCVLVRPIKWKPAVGLVGPADKTNHNAATQYNKVAAVDLARKRFPEAKAQFLDLRMKRTPARIDYAKLHGRAEAALLAGYCREFVL